MADPIASDKSASSDSPAPAATPAAPPVTGTLPPVTAAAPPVTAATSAAVSAPTPQPAPSYTALAKDSRVKPLQLLVLLIVFAITGVGSLMLLASAMRPPESQPRPASPAAPAPEAAVDRAVAAAPVAPGAAVESPESTAAPRQKWLASANSRKAGYGANMVFELAADNDVEVWRKRVRPVLTMRCAAKTTEVFVVTNSPATIEGNSNRHTVKVSFDDREPVEQTWEHSIDHDALFALNGAGMMRQIGTAKQMSFSWQPFNAPPATATFSVEGFDAHRKTAASKCRP